MGRLRCRSWRSVSDTPRGAARVRTSCSCTLLRWRRCRRPACRRSRRKSSRSPCRPHRRWSSSTCCMYARWRRRPVPCRRLRRSLDCRSRRRCSRTCRCSFRVHRRNIGGSARRKPGPAGTSRTSSGFRTCQAVFRRQPPPSRRCSLRICWRRGRRSTSSSGRTCRIRAFPRRSRADRRYRLRPDRSFACIRFPVRSRRRRSASRGGLPRPIHRCPTRRPYRFRPLRRSLDRLHPRSRRRPARYSAGFRSPRAREKWSRVRRRPKYRVAAQLDTESYRSLAIKTIQRQGIFPIAE